MGSNSGIAAPPTFFCLRHQIPFPHVCFESRISFNRRCCRSHRNGKIRFQNKGLRGPESGKWIKMFLSTEEVSSLTMELPLCRIQERFPGLRGNAFSVKYFDGKDWIEFDADDLDSFIGMIETAQRQRENLKKITIEVKKISFTPPGVDTAKSQQKRLRRRQVRIALHKIMRRKSKN